MSNDHPNFDAPRHVDTSPQEDIAAARTAPRLGLLRPLRRRDFRLLWTAMTISLTGDGIYYVAIAFEVYRLSNSPQALSMVFLAWTLPMIPMFLVSGVISDRLDRRYLMVASDLVRGSCLVIMGALSLAGTLRLTHVMVLVAIYGIADALFMPAFTAIVPDVVPDDELVQANALDQFVRPVTWRFLGPAVGGGLVAAATAGGAILVNAATFFASAICIGAMRLQTRVPRQDNASGVLNEIREGITFVRHKRWLSGTLFAAGVALFCFIGPLEILVPYVIKNELGGGAAGYGAVLAVGGIGGVLAAVVMGQRELPRHHITFMYLMWAAGVMGIAGFALVDQLWQAMLVSFITSTLFAAVQVVWGTLIHRLVPSHLLGRVSSIDWLISTSLVPISYAATGPIAEITSPEATLAGAGIIGALVVLATLAVPGIRSTDDTQRP